MRNIPRTHRGVDMMKPLTAALIAGGVLVSTAGAFTHFKGDTHVAAATPAKTDTTMLAAASTGSTAAAAAVVPAAPIPMVAQGLVPNYRAIVKQAGPAVVGVTVEGTHKLTAEDMGLPPGAENDPF